MMEIDKVGGDIVWLLTLVFGKQTASVTFEPQHPQRIERLQREVAALTGVDVRHQRLLHRGAELRADGEGLADGARLLLLRNAAFHKEQAAAAVMPATADAAVPPAAQSAAASSRSAPKAPAVDVDALEDDDVLVLAMRGRAEYALVLKRDAALLVAKQRLCAMLGVGSAQGIRLVVKGKTPPDHTPLSELLPPARGDKPAARSFKCMVLLNAQQHVLAEKEDELRELLNELTQLQVNAKRVERQVARNFASREETMVRVVALVDGAQRVQSNLELLLEHLSPKGGAANQQTSELLTTAISEAQALSASCEALLHRLTLL